MKTLPILLLLTLIGCSKDLFTDAGTFTDSRDNNVYNLVQIGKQVWMAENLAYLPAVNTSTVGSETEPLYYVYDYEGSSIYEAQNHSNYTTYGVLYNWVAAKTACPNGWHLPTDHEWSTMTNCLAKYGYGYDGYGNAVAKSMASTFGWCISSIVGSVGYNQASNNSSGFDALPGGERNLMGGFRTIGEETHFWTADFVKTRSMYCYFSNVMEVATGASSGYSVRCLMNK